MLSEAKHLNVRAVREPPLQNITGDSSAQPQNDRGEYLNRANTLIRSSTLSGMLRTRALARRNMLRESYPDCRLRLSYKDP